MKEYAYKLKMKVRDYECDLEGIVNNANYQHYMEHTRHEFLLEAGISFAEMLEQNIVSVVARITIDYKTPLRSRDEFLSCLNVRLEGIRYVFCQDIYRVSDMKLAAKGKVDVVCLVDGKLSRCPELEEKLKVHCPEL
ncbi:MAG: acyl-CoA thioesterase [Bacteroidaceae bacterium]|jgi:acyl-CoA thioester hydrolase|nr:acyl-CoA thioesterase [Bacteroidaceae bacterium]